MLIISLCPSKIKEDFMKELSTYNRAAGYLNRLFDLMNQEFFESVLYFQKDYGLLRSC